MSTLPRDWIAFHDLFSCACNSSNTLQQSGLLAKRLHLPEIWEGSERLLLVHVHVHVYSGCLNSLHCTIEESQSDFAHHCQKRYEFDMQQGTRSKC